MRQLVNVKSTGEFFQTRVRSGNAELPRDASVKSAWLAMEITEDKVVLMECDTVARLNEQSVLFIQFRPTKGS